MDTKYTDFLDIDKFLPSAFSDEDVIRALTTETPCKVSQLNDLFNLPVNSNYKGDMSNYAKSIENEKLMKPELKAGKIGDLELDKPLQIEAVENKYEDVSLNEAIYFHDVSLNTFS